MALTCLLGLVLQSGLVLKPSQYRLGDFWDPHIRRQLRELSDLGNPRRIQLVNVSFEDISDATQVIGLLPPVIATITPVTQVALITWEWRGCVSYLLHSLLIGIRYKREKALL
jgi:hypothetical protein